MSHVTVVRRATSVDLFLDNMSPVIISTTLHSLQLAAHDMKHLIAYLDSNFRRPSPTSVLAGTLRKLTPTFVRIGSSLETRTSGNRLLVYCVHTLHNARWRRIGSPGAMDVRSTRLDGPHRLSREDDPGVVVPLFLLLCVLLDFIRGSRHTNYHLFHL
jgi:hypothetical protein